MITIKQVEKLMTISSDKYPIISFYLGIPPVFLIQKKYKTLAKGLIKKGTANLSRFNDEQKEFIEKDAEKIFRFIDYEFDEKAKGLAIFSSTGLNLWQVYPLPTRLKGRFIIDADPYTRPLVKFFDENERYFIVFVDRKKARFFSSYTGIVNEREEFSEEIQGRHKKGGWSQARFQRHIKNQTIKHLNNISDVLYGLYKKEKFDHLILGGSRKAVFNFKNILHSSLQKIIVGDVEGSIDDSTSEIFSSVHEIINNFEKKQSKKYLKTLFDRLGKKHLAVSGLGETVKMLHQARIHTLIVKEDLILPGYKCNSCETPYTTRIEKCSLCSKKIVEVPDIIDEIIEKTWELNGEVKFIKTSKELDASGGIAALLRW
ncbi:MAG: hypothetical protein E3J87_02035 [Candidatus Cloacimonadota bacterium]|nr:MAG: hypothetical protein E3J87_02035 [Candidatus Cloacimonadota bacterium]